ncbi:MAG: thymidylate kinase [Candidatus Nanosalina sp. J07AB43]|nr:MAG: thymidylate kinase [Candidatus Nanosalina sp. J07AB43]
MKIAVVTEEPSDLSFGQQVRQRLSQHDSNPVIDFFLFMADRQHHINERIQPAMRDGKLVVSDRYADSTRAYQPVALTGDSIEKPFDSEWEAKYFIEQCMEPWNLTPDLTLYLDIRVDTAIERISGEDTYENRTFLRQVKENYEALCDTHERIVRIDGEQPKDDVAWDALTQMNLLNSSAEKYYNYKLRREQ